VVAPVLRGATAPLSPHPPRMDPPSPAFFVASLPPRRNALTRWLSGGSSR